MKLLYTRLLKCIITLHASCGAVYCNQSCLFVAGCVCLCWWVCYHDNSKLCASILTKLGFVGKGNDHLQLITFWLPCPREGGLRRGENFWLGLTTASVQCLRPLWALFLFEFWKLFLSAMESLRNSCEMVCTSHVVSIHVYVGEFQKIGTLELPLEYDMWLRNVLTTFGEPVFNRSWVWAAIIDYGWIVFCSVSPWMSGLMQWTR